MFAFYPDHTTRFIDTIFFHRGLKIEFVVYTGVSDVAHLQNPETRINFPNPVLKNRIDDNTAVRHCSFCTQTQQPELIFQPS